MVERIVKIKSTEPWKVGESAETKKDKRDQSKEERKQEGDSSFGEKPDWGRLIAKEVGKSETINLLTHNIKSLEFKGISTLKDPSALEVDVVLADGSRKNSAFISIPRTQGLKLKHHKPGDSLPLELFGKDPYLKVSIMMHPPSPQNLGAMGGDGPGASESGGPEGKPRSFLSFRQTPEAMSILSIVLYAVAACLILIAVVGIFRLLV